MPWYIGLDSMVSVDASEATTEQQAIEIARERLAEWLIVESRDFTIELDWNVEYEEGYDR